MNLQFKKSDIIDQVSLYKNIEETYNRVLSRNLKEGRRTKEKILEDTELGLVLEYYLIQNDTKFKKATDLNYFDYYHDLIDTESGEIHECKVTRSKLGWESDYVVNSINRITSGDWNKSKWMHLATYDEASETYTYQGVKQIR